MVRKFAVADRLAQNTAGGVLDIPHPSILDNAGADELLEDFKMSYGVLPTAVALPAASTDGLLFPVAGLEGHRSSFLKGSAFEEIVGAFANRGMGIYLTIDPRLQFLSSDELHVEDVLGTGSTHLCLNKTLSHEIIAAILGTGYDLASEITV